MSKINDILEYIGAPYRLSTIDKEPIIYRHLKILSLKSPDYINDLWIVLFIYG